MVAHTLCSGPWGGFKEGKSKKACAQNTKVLRATKFLDEHKQDLKVTKIVKVCVCRVTKTN